MPLLDMGALPEVLDTCVVSTKNSFLHFEDLAQRKERRQRSFSDAALFFKEDKGYSSDSTCATREAREPSTPDSTPTPDDAATPYLLDLGKREREPRECKKRRDVPPPCANEITLMVRNIPNKYTPEGLLQTFAEYHDAITFYYLPTDFKNRCNLGYAFVNFCDQHVASQFADQLQNQKLPHFEKSEKVLLVQPARVQGFAANVKRFRNSSVMGVLPDDCKPMIFDCGVQQPFPTPGRKIPPIGPRFRAGQ
jgi:hypothetical protein